MSLFFFFSGSISYIDQTHFLTLLPTFPDENQNDLNKHSETVRLTLFLLLQQNIHVFRARTVYGVSGSEEVMSNIN